jgi:voltage-gated potassium channel
MAGGHERTAAPAPAHPTREERVERWFDGVIGRRGLRPRYAAYLVIATWVVAVAVFGIVQRIADPETFPTIWGAWWWAIQTVTTVGYGDAVPGETGGKVVAAILMIGGLAFVTILTATITSSFVARREAQARARGDDPVLQHLRQLSDQIDALEVELRRARAGDDDQGAPPVPAGGRDP